MEWVFKLTFLAVLFAFLAFVLWLRFLVIRRIKEMKGKEVDFIRNGFVYFYSDRCGACKIMKGEIEKLKGRAQVKQVDIFSPEGSLLAKRLGIVATPTTLYVKNGIIQKAFVGVVKGERLLSETSSDDK
ncbi:MAG: thioredoxin family protein [Hydrogenobacter sp.]|uniref:thioredoxin family protein n=1 Tax=Hydrogenobacter thermophilus TaxID=940 RepID=UPI0030F8509F